MRISRIDAIDFFDHFGYIDLQEQKYYPSMKLARLKKLNIGLTDTDYSIMEHNNKRFLRPPVRNPLYDDFIAALQAGINCSKLLSFGYHKSDADQEFLPYEEGLLLRDRGLSQKKADAMHALRVYLIETNSYDSFLANWESTRMKTIQNWLLQYGIEIEY